MKFFLDTEFIEAPGKLELISIGIVPESGVDGSFYAESTDFNPDDANPWVKENVYPHLDRFMMSRTQGETVLVSGNDVKLVSTREGIANSLRSWIASYTDEPEFWGYYADYDWVVFCWLFGAMVDLPKGYPMFCRDIRQLIECHNRNPSKKPSNPGTAHNALGDAIYHRLLYGWAGGQPS